MALPLARRSFSEGGEPSADVSENGATGTSDIEGKGARGSTESGGSRSSFKRPYLPSV
jgi:hypothetical protein